MANREHLDYMDLEILSKLRGLVKETFLLWDEVWVGFSWRNYYYNHTQRVLALCIRMGRAEGADLRKLEYAALLHDVSKRYDGEILTDSRGRRVVNEDGFWLNELLLPRGENLITRLYRRFNQFHKLHNVSGALIASKVLERNGLPGDFASSVASIIKSHLNPDIFKEESPEDPLEKRILYEADTIDANLGLTAFYRNVQINTHHRIRGKGLSALREYIHRIDPWIRGKTSFLDQISTQTGTSIAERRLERVKEAHSHVREEMENNPKEGLEWGLLGVIRSFMNRNSDPNLLEDTKYLLTTWIPRRRRVLKAEEADVNKQMFQNAVTFCHMLSKEIEGKA